MNHMEDVAKMLNLKLNQPFRIIFDGNKVSDTVYNNNNWYRSERRKCDKYRLYRFIIS